MAKPKAVAGTKVDITNRDVWEGFEAIGALTSRGWGDAKTALALGRTARSLRTVRDDIDHTRQMLLKSYGEVSPEGGVQMKDRLGFGQEWEKLMAQPASVEVYPVSVTAIVSGQKQCETCHRGPIDDISALYLETLVYIGALQEDGA